MSILERPNSPEAPAAGKRPPSDRLRVITAGQVGNMQARLGASGFDVVAVAETEDALIDAVSGDEPDAIVVDADLCDSLEYVRDLAPDAVLIVVGDHTPVGALGRIERGVSGTVMAGLLHALVAQGVGAAAPWGLVPAFGRGAAVHVPQSVVGSLLSAKADFVRAYLVNAVHALREHAELVTAASTVAVTVSAGVLLTVSEPRTDERLARVPVPAPAVEYAPQERPRQHPGFAVSPTTPISTPGPSRNESEPSDQQAPNRGDSTRTVVTTIIAEYELDQWEGNDDPIVNESNDDQVVNEGNDDHGQNDDPDGQNENAHGRNEGNGDHGRNDNPHGQNEDAHDKNEGNDDHGENGDPDGQTENAHGGNEGNGDHGRNDDPHGKNEDSETDEGDDQGEDEDTESEVDDGEGENESESGQDEDNDDLGEDNDDQGEDE
jgi:hypothetical protein